MAIAEETGQGRSNAEESRTLELFTDRYDLTRRFSSYLNEDPCPNKLLYFYGEPGNGKTLLLRYLKKKCCKRIRDIDNWNAIKEIEGSKFLTHLQNAEDVDDIPCILIDFDSRDNYFNPKEPVDVLMKIRRDFGDMGFSFHFFDYAMIWYLKSVRQLDENKIKSLFADEKTDIVFSIVELVFAPLGPTKAILKHIGKKVGPTWYEYIKRRKIEDKDVEEIRGLEPRELLNWLPKYLALDLNASMLKEKSARRAVLLFDTHEALWGFEGKMASNYNSEMLDIWLRNFLAHLELKDGIVVVVAGREPPNWSKVSKWKIPEEYIDLHAVDFLSWDDALRYLEKAGIEEENHREAIVSNLEEYGLVHPFLLGLCADTELTKIRQGIEFDAKDYLPKLEQKSILSQVIDRFLRYTDRDTSRTFKALGACRTFDESLYYMLGKELYFPVSAERYKLITREYSLVKEYPLESMKQSSYAVKGDNGKIILVDPDYTQTRRFSLHSLFRRLLHDNKDEVTIVAHQKLKEYYCQKITNEANIFKQVRELVIKADDPLITEERFDYFANKQTSLLLPFLRPQFEHDNYLTNKDNDLLSKAFAMLNEHWNQIGSVRDTQAAIEAVYHSSYIDRRMAFKQLSELVNRADLYGEEWLYEAMETLLLELQGQNDFENGVLARCQAKCLGSWIKGYDKAQPYFKLALECLDRYIASEQTDETVDAYFERAAVFVGMVNLEGKLSLLMLRSVPGVQIIEYCQKALKDLSKVVVKRPDWLDGIILKARTHLLLIEQLGINATEGSYEIVNNFQQILDAYRLAIKVVPHENKLKLKFARNCENFIQYINKYDLSGIDETCVTNLCTEALNLLGKIPETARLQFWIRETRAGLLANLARIQARYAKGLEGKKKAWDTFFDAGMEYDEACDYLKHNWDERYPELSSLSYEAGVVRFETAQLIESIWHENRGDLWRQAKTYYSMALGDFTTAEDEVYIGGYDPEDEDNYSWDKTSFLIDVWIATAETTLCLANMQARLLKEYYDVHGSSLNYLGREESNSSACPDEESIDIPAEVIFAIRDADKWYYETASTCVDTALKHRPRDFNIIELKLEICIAHAKLKVFLGHSEIAADLYREAIDLIDQVSNTMLFRQYREEAIKELKRLAHI
ncbi:MAG: hypothetical protein PHX14_11235 [Syntrophomonadaceae bacterium]|nr:hypothetical protein [Syntrophomonadaceae bacterium]